MPTSAKPMAESTSEEHLGILPALQVLGQEGAGLPQILGHICKAKQMAMT